MQEDPKNIPLPDLRSDLLVFETTSNHNGEPRWQIYDPTRNQYFLIGFVAYNYYKFWHSAKTVADLQNVVSKMTVLSPSIESIVDFIVFLQKGNLIICNSSAAIKALTDSYLKTKSSLIQKLVHNYLFFRIPLIKPDKFLTKTYPYIKFLLKKQTLIFFITLFCLALYLVLQQLDVYFSTFLHFFNVKGLIYYGLMLALVKIAHEFGHAYAAKHYNCEVPVMGVAFLVMWPVLYTDATAVWRLKSKKQRLIVASAGIIVESAIAIISLFIWSFLDEGIFRSIVFFITTVTWFGTIFINLNFFMRFDGYYLLSDALEVENLQGRSFNLAKSYMRQFLFGYKTEIDKSIPKSKHKILVLFSFGVWIYRFFLFLGIAFLVYHFAFKVLGIILFIIEIVFFIIAPIYREIKEWIRRSQDVTLNKSTIRTLIVFISLILLLIFPWQTNVSIPAYLDYKNIATISNQDQAVIKEIFVENNQLVKKGDLLVSLTSPYLETQLKLAEIEVKNTNVLTNRSVADAKNLSFYQVNSSLKNKAKAKYNAISQQISELNIIAPFDGKVVFFDDYLKADDWLAKNSPILSVIDESEFIVSGYIEEKYLDLIDPKTTVTFFRENSLFNSIKLSYDTISNVNVALLDHPELASVHGGNIAVNAISEQQLLPVKTLYKITFSPIDASKVLGRVSDTGTIKIKTERNSIISSLFKTVSLVLIRETGF